MKQFTISGWRGIKDADILLDKVTVISGINGAGKTSIIEAILAASQGDAMIYKPLTKSKMKLVIHDGQKQAMVEINIDDHKSSITLPDVAISAEGEPVFVSEYATGFKDILSQSEKERFKFLTKLFNAEPSKEELIEAIKEAGMPEAKFNQLWETVEGLSWDAAHKQISTAGAEKKGAWDYVTGEKYGSSKGETWLPEGWTPDLMNIDTDKLRVQYEGLRKRYHQQEAGVLTDDEKAKLEGKANQLPEYEKACKSVSEKNNFITNQLTDLANARKKLTSLIEGKNIQPLKCPECEAELLMEKNELVSYKPDSVEDKKKWQAEIKQIEKDIKEIDKSGVENDQEIHQLRDTISDAQSAEQKLQSAGSEFDPELEKKYLTAESRLNNYEKRLEAEKLHKQIQKIAIVARALSESGLRLAKLESAIKGINEMFKVLTKDTGWQPAKLDNGLNIYYGDRPYCLLSQSEELRVKIQFQLLITYTDKSAFMMIDRADILDKPGRNGLLKIIRKENIPVIIAMTLNESSECPNFKDKDGYRTYWIDENHNAKELNQ